MDFHTATFYRHASVALRNPDKAGRLCMSLQYTEADSFWWCLAGPLLYYFESEQSDTPKGCILLSSCIANIVDAVDDNGKDVPCFELKIGDDWSLSLAAPSTEALIGLCPQFSILPSQVLTFHLFVPPQIGPLR